MPNLTYGTLVYNILLYITLGRYTPNVQCMIYYRGLTRRRRR